MSWDDLQVLAEEYHKFVQEGYGTCVEERCPRQIQIANELVVRLQHYFKILAERSMSGGIRAFEQLHKAPDFDNVEDLVQDASVGLIKSLHNYSPEKCRLSTFVKGMFAGYVLRNSGYRMRMIRCPYDIFSEVNRSFKNGLKGLEEYFNEELSTQKDVLKPEVSPFAKAMAMYLALTGEYQDMWGVPSDKNKNYGRGDSFEMIYLSTEDEDAFEILRRKEMIEQLGLEKLSDRELLVLRECMIRGNTLIFVGKEMGVSKERVNQIKVRGIRKLKNFYYGNDL
jgi:RNA polymerase primary sigma factor